jgi:hypothetical protein
MKFISLKYWLNERKNDTLEYGCLMLYSNMSKNKWKKYTSIVNKEDIYIKDNDYGYEKEPHITIIYGLHDDEIERKDLYEKIEKIINPIQVKINNISIFETDDYDVIKFDVPINDQLKNYRKEFMRFPNTQTYDSYHPHMTIAYVKKGEGKKYIQKVKSFEVEFRRAVYSPSSGQKKYFDLGQLNEKFTQDSDPIHDMGVGLPEIIKNAFKKIIQYDKKQSKNVKQRMKMGSNELIPINTYVPCTIREIKIKGNILTVSFFSNTLYNRSGNKINKLKYLEKLLKIGNIFDMIELIKDQNDFEDDSSGFYDFSFCFECIIKSQYVKYFNEIPKEDYNIYI